MRLAVVAAKGKAGKLIVEEAVKRGIDVTAIVREENKTIAQNAIIKDVFSINKEDLLGFDVVVDALGAWTPETVKVVPDGAKHLA